MRARSDLHGGLGSKDAAPLAFSNRRNASVQCPRFTDRGPTPSQVICVVAEPAPTRTRAADVGELYKPPPN